MSEETLRMSRKERDRLIVFGQVQERRLSLREASERLNLSYRQTKRCWRRFCESGASGLIHCNREMPSNRAKPRAFKEQILELYATHYREYGPTLAAEVLEEEHGLAVKAETLRRWLHGAFLYATKRSPRQHRRRRERRRRFGELVQIDGSHHAWFGERAETACLMVAVDDATGRTLAHMGEEETTADAYALLIAWMRRYGVPEAIYVDKRNIYVSEREPTRDEVRQGSGALTDFGRACWRLGIRIVLANSPEAKGRVERKNGVLQDRFVKFLARRGISDIATANQALPGFLEDLDRKQAKKASDPVDAHRQAPSERLLRDVCCWEVKRTVARDWTISYKGECYQIARQDGAPSPRDHVIVRKRLDASVGIYWRQKELKCTGDSASNLSTTA